jgi:hypothetical protein
VANKLAIKAGVASITVGIAGNRPFDDDDDDGNATLLEVGPRDLVDVEVVAAI